MDPVNPLPAGLKTSEIDGLLVVSRRWYSSQTWLSLVFALFWNGFMYNWYKSVLSADVPQMMLVLFPVVHVGVGLWLAYRALTGFTNSTEVRIGNGRVVVRHGPLPWPGNKDVDAQTIKQLFCDEKASAQGRFGQQQISYRVNMIMLDDRRDVLVGAGLDREQALYLEKVAERRLGIAPARVVGELS